MGLTEEEAYDILELAHNSSYEAVLKSYKRLSLMWFPDIHGFNAVALEKFRKISLALLKLSLPDAEINYSLSVEDMFVLFEEIFFDGVTHRERCNLTGETKNGRHEKSDRKQEKQGERSGLICKTEKGKPEKSAIKQYGERTGLTCETKSEKCEKSDTKQEKQDDQQPASAEGQSGTADERDIIRKQMKKAEKRKAEKKRKKEKKKLEKALQEQKDNEEDVHSTSLKNSQEKGEAGGKQEAVSSDYYRHHIPDYDGEFDNWSQTISDDDDCDDYYPCESDYMDADDNDCVDSDDCFGPGYFLNRLYQKFGADAAKKATNNALALILEDEKKKKHIEQRKTQKKKRKEKRKLEKASESEQNKNQSGGTSCANKSLEENDKENVPDSEEDIDLSSAFVTVIAKKKKLYTAKTISDNSKERWKGRSGMKEKMLSPNQAESTTDNFCLAESTSNLQISECSKVHMDKDEDIFISDSDSEFAFPWGDCGQEDTKDMKNFESGVPAGGHAAIWVGNVHEEVSVELLTSIFSRYGRIKNVRKLPGKVPGMHCAFINYNDKTSAGKAMEAVQGMQLFGSILKIRYPKRAVETANEECYFWRTTGCAYPDTCRFKHVRANKGIDRKRPL